MQEIISKWVNNEWLFLLVSFIFSYGLVFTKVPGIHCMAEIIGRYLCVVLLHQKKKKNVKSSLASRFIFIEVFELSTSVCILVCWPEIDLNTFVELSVQFSDKPLETQPFGLHKTTRVC